MPPRWTRWRRGWKPPAWRSSASQRRCADQRFVSGLISFADPAGNRLEAFHGAQVADAPFSPGRNISGFRTGPLGMGHMRADRAAMATCWHSTAMCWASSISDYITEPVNAYFLHANPRHHSVALVEGRQPACTT